MGEGEFTRENDNIYVSRVLTAEYIRYYVNYIYTAIDVKKKKKKLSNL